MWETLHTVVAFTFFSEGAHFEVVWEGGREVVTVEIPASCHVCEAHRLTALNGVPANSGHCICASASMWFNNTKNQEIERSDRRV